METNLTTNPVSLKIEKEIMKLYNAGMTRKAIRFKYKITNEQFTLVITKHIQTEKKKKAIRYRVQ